MSGFHVNVRLRVCSSRALSRLRALFRVGAWCSDPGAHVLSFGFVSGFGHSSLCVRSQVRSAARSSCVLLCCTQFVFLSAACIHAMSWSVWHAACVFIAFMLSCLV